MASVSPSLLTTSGLALGWTWGKARKHKQCKGSTECIGSEQITEQSSLPLGGALGPRGTCSSTPKSIHAYGEKKNMCCAVCLRFPDKNILTAPHPLTCSHIGIDPYLTDALSPQSLSPRGASIHVLACNLNHSLYAEASHYMQKRPLLPVQRPLCPHLLLKRVPSLVLHQPFSAVPRS